MWRDICELNSASLLNVIEGLQKSLEKLRNFIAHKDFEALEAEFQRAKDLRDSLLDNSTEEALTIGEGKCQ
jgi:prephenate dehydrogenase